MPKQISDYEIKWYKLDKLKENYAYSLVTVILYNYNIKWLLFYDFQNINSYNNIFLYYLKSKY